MKKVLQPRGLINFRTIMFTLLDVPILLIFTTSNMFLKVISPLYIVILLEGNTGNAIYNNLISFTIHSPRRLMFP